MKLTFCGKSPQQRFFRIGVVGNNLADDRFDNDNRQETRQFEPCRIYAVY